MTPQKAPHKYPPFLFLLGTVVKAYCPNRTKAYYVETSFPKIKSVDIKGPFWIPALLFKWHHKSYPGYHLVDHRINCNPVWFLGSAPLSIVHSDWFNFSLIFQKIEQSKVLREVFLKYISFSGLVFHRDYGIYHVLVNLVAHKTAGFLSRAS